MTLPVFLRYISQNILGMLGLSCYILADTLFVSAALGPDGLAALNLSITVFSIISGVGQLCGVGGGTDYALRRGKGQDAAHAATTAVTVGMLFALLFAIAGFLLSAPLSRLLGADETTFAMTEIYVRTTLLFAPVYILNAMMQGFVRNDGAPHLAILSLLISSGANIVLDYVFMFPFAMGIFGAVLATGLSACLAAPVLLSHFLRKRCSIRFALRLLPLRDLLKQLSYGVSALIGELASAVSLLTFNLLLMRLSGYIGVAAYGVIANAALVATAVFTGLGQGIQPLASKAHALCDQTGIRRLLFYIHGTVLLLSVLIFLLVFRFSQPITGAFNHEHNAQLQEIAAQGLRIYFAGYLFAGVNIAGTALLSAVGRTRQALFVSLLRSCVLLIPAAIAFSHTFGIIGVWLAFVATEAICCLLSFSFMKADLISEQSDIRS
ncbi:MAG: polysaccharide biosynthesis C-terminal domain-containing protein [Clostridia bacterium]|nr:polysaccharide biosynthesis C-terminal domain-containing protein [Clostridia bacterium]